MSPPRLPVILLWHMHQPQYRDALTGQYTLPWTYLHAIKDYTDMAAHLESNPAARAVVNFTPLLIEQLEEIARRIAEHLKAGTPLPDPVLALLGPEAVPSAPAERLALLRACLRGHRQHMIERFGPYLELATIAETLGTLERIAYASDQFIQDLAVWHHLAWLGETVRRSDPLVARLTARGREFTPGQRRDLLTLIGEHVAQLVPRYRAPRRGRSAVSETRTVTDHPAAAGLRGAATRCGGAAPKRSSCRWRGPRAGIEEAVRVPPAPSGPPPAGCYWLKAPSAPPRSNCSARPAAFAGRPAAARCCAAAWRSPTRRQPPIRSPTTAPTASLAPA
jgi:DNA-binding GntR family transcriptional regulator